MIQKWEYDVRQWVTRSLRNTTTLIDDLNRLGLEGWEVITLIPSDPITTAVLKRPVMEVTPRDDDRFRSKQS